MSKRGDFECIADIQEAVRRIENYTKDVGYKEFLKNIKTQDAVVRNLEIIGEVAKNISADFRGKYKNIDWKKIAGMRDKLVHHYFGVNLNILWNAVKEKLPELKGEIERLLPEITKK